MICLPFRKPTVTFLNASFLCLVLLAPAHAVPDRMPAPNGPGHSNELIHYAWPRLGLEKAIRTETIDILIVTAGGGSLTGISPVQEKEYWVVVLIAFYAAVERR